jgi:hypothetical protein
MWEAVELTAAAQHRGGSGSTGRGDVCRGLRRVVTGGELRRFLRTGKETGEVSYTPQPRGGGKACAEAAITGAVKSGGDPAQSDDGRRPPVHGNGKAR